MTKRHLSPDWEETGPWRAVQDKRIPDKWYVVQPFKNANYPDGRYDGDQVMFVDDPYEADMTYEEAHLIAAAPDLLAALEEIKNHEDAASCGDSYGDAVQNLARAAIAKAKGES